MTNEPGRSPWFYVAIGCGALTLLVVAAVVTISIIGVRAAKQFKAEMSDPGTRAAKVKAALGAEKLPAGYHGMMALEIPFLAEITILTDRPPDAGGRAKGPGTRLFVYTRVLRSDERKKQEFRDYLEGLIEDPRALIPSNVSIDTHEVVRRDRAEVRGIPVPYAVQRGTFRLEGEQGKEIEGLMNMMMFDCPEDPKLRMGIWIGPDVPAEEGSAEVDLSGTPADEAALVAFLEHFTLCGTPD